MNLVPAYRKVRIVQSRHEERVSLPTEIRLKMLVNFYWEKCWSEKCLGLMVTMGETSRETCLDKTFPDSIPGSQVVTGWSLHLRQDGRHAQFSSETSTLKNKLGILFFKITIYVSDVVFASSPLSNCPNETSIFSSLYQHATHNPSVIRHMC